MNWPFEIPEIKKEHLPYAYAFIAIGALTLIKRPSTLVSLLSAYYMWQNTIQKGKDALDNR